MAGKQLTPQNATITTATVEVKALTISGKQVTLAVFRQLQEESPIKSDGTLLGEPWGIVNYHPDKCADRPEHLHVVWQYGNELRRSAVQMPGVGYHRHPMADIYVHARIIDGTAHRPYTEPAADDSLRLGEMIPNGWRTFAGGRFEYDGMSFEGATPDWLRTMWRSSSPVPDERRQSLASSLAMLDISPTDPADQIHAALLAKIPTEEYRNFVIELIQLPQLFIAV